MATRKYIQIGNSTQNDTSYKKFMVTEMQIPSKRMDSIDYTLGGKTDKQAGPILHEYGYVIRCGIDTAWPDSGYGTYAELLALYNLNEVHGTPTDVITLHDHWDTAHTVYFSGDMVPTPVSVIIEGRNGTYLVPITLVEKL